MKRNRIFPFIFLGIVLLTCMACLCNCGGGGDDDNKLKITPPSMGTYDPESVQSPTTMAAPHGMDKPNLTTPEPMEESNGIEQPEEIQDPGGLKP